MKSKLLLALIALALVVPIVSFAEQASTPTAELKALFERTTAKIRAGKKTAAELADELAAFDALRAKYREQKTEEVAQILFLQATLYSQVLNDAEKGRELFTQLKAEFPGTKVAAAVDEVIAAEEQEAKAERRAAELVGKPAPAMNFIWASRDGLKTLGDLKGKVVVLDFWATWCGPCVQSFPHVRELAEHYKGSDVEVVGVTSIQGSVVGLEPRTINTKGDPKKEMDLMKDYMKAKDITWTIAFSEQEVFNPDYGVVGIPHVAIVAPDGTIRHTGLHPAAPLAEKVAKIDALLQEFGKPVAAKSTKP